MSNPYPSLRSTRSLRSAFRGAFTLIELLAVMAIILLLAGLILSIAGHANYKAASARAESEIQAFSAALEGYKTDNGAYPRSAATDALNANSNTATNINPGGTTPTAYQQASVTLFQALSGYSTVTNTISGKPYFSFTPGQMSANPPTSTTYVVDPFGLSYGYSTYNVAATANAVPPATPSPTAGFNPTFDLWSTGGYSASGGKAYPAAVTAPNTLWIKNW